MQLNGTNGPMTMAASEPPEPPPRNPDKINASLKQITDSVCRLFYCGVLCPFFFIHFVATIIHFKFMIIIIHTFIMNTKTTPKPKKKKKEE